MKFQSIYNFVPTPAVISSESEVKRDESLTISQIISLHLRGLPTNVHVYDDVKYEIGDSYYRDEQLNEDYYEMENDLSDFNCVTHTSGDYVSSVPVKRDDATTNQVTNAESVQFASEPGANEEEEIQK